MLIKPTSQSGYECNSESACACKRSSTEASRDVPMPRTVKDQVFLRWLLITVLTFMTIGAINAPAVELRVMTYNIHHAEGMDKKVDAARIAQVISSANADLVALQEVDRGVERSQKLDLPKIIASNLGFSFAFGKNINYQGGEYGNAILSRFPILESNNHHYKMLREGEQRGLLHAKIEINGNPLLFIATHIDYRPDNAERLSNVKEILQFADEHSDTPIILCGDFNDTPNSEVHLRLKERFSDAWESGGEGPEFTYSSTKPTKRIDFIFVSDTVRVNKAKVLETEASDHLPLFVELDVDLKTTPSQ
ncbi:MAG: endonuclease/exonuclease/phosphatase family protein [Candidatus Hinthialibacter antarcticus]|nr:endonuclease/exonuclease/phosphatase family protein [Candidatus Hinthialibacter antarcticus]